MSINFATLQGLTIPEGVVTQITDASGRVLWAKRSGSDTVILEVEKITSDTYAAGTTYTGERFILLDIYPKTNGTVSVTYGGLTKTITDTSGAEKPIAQQVFFGTFNGVSDSVTTPDSGTLTIKGGYSNFEVGDFYLRGNRKYCGCITGITEWGNITSIGHYAFIGCTSLTSITIPNSVTSIGTSAFRDCTSLTSITIGDSVTSIGNSAFRGCASLTSITIPDSVTSIGAAAFSYCTSLASITIPDSVTSIGKDAFYQCASLTSITIPDSVTSIGGYAFGYCTSLTSVYITDIEKWCKISFYDEGSNPMYNGADLYLNGNLVTDLTIPDTVTSIGNYAFRGCASLTSITIPDSVTSIGKGAFIGCTSLTSVTFTNTSGWYVTKTEGGDASTGTAVDVSDTANNATLITDTYRTYYWYRS